MIGAYCIYMDLDYIRCRHCKSQNIEYYKYMAFGPKAGNQYHYRLKCKKCGKSYSLKKTKFVYEKVKDQPWVYSKSKKQLMQAKLFN